MPHAPGESRSDGESRAGEEGERKGRYVNMGFWDSGFRFQDAFRSIVSETERDDRKKAHRGAGECKSSATYFIGYTILNTQVKTYVTSAPVRPCPCLDCLVSLFYEGGWRIRDDLSYNSGRAANRTALRSRAGCGGGSHLVTNKNSCKARLSELRGLASWC